MQALASHTLHACPSCSLGALPARRCHQAAALARPAARRAQRARTLCTHAFGGVAAWPGSYEPSGLASAVGLGLAGLLALWVTLEVCPYSWAAVSLLCIGWHRVVACTFAGPVSVLEQREGSGPVCSAPRRGGECVLSLYVSRACPVARIPLGPVGPCAAFGPEASRF